MPLYEYGCESCNQVHEVMQKFSDQPLAECPSCQGPVRKLMSRSSFALKGTGWYSTDYKKPNSKACNSSSESKPPCCSSGSCPH